MSTQLRNKLEQFEVRPPEACWSKISARLDDEYSSADTVVSATLANASADVPQNSWQKIASVLDADQNNSFNQTKAAPVVPFRTKWMQRIAAVFVLALGITLVYRYAVLPGNSATEPINPVIAVTPQRNLSVLPVPEASDNSNTNVPRLTRINRNGKKSGSSARTTSGESQAVYLAETTSPEMRYASIVGAERPSLSRPISVNSEPIRDAEGNIIMDEKLVSAPDNNYVTVTGPNGEQTKMSKKFFRALSYLNANSDADANIGVTLQESALWKWLFQEWRTKLIQDPTFIPSSTNFLDILEMKDMLSDQL